MILGRYWDQVKRKIPRIEMPWSGQSAGKTMPDNPLMSYYVVLFSSICLLAIGVIMVFSASYIVALHDQTNPYKAFAKRNLIPLALGALAMVIGARIPARFWKAIAYVVFGACLALQMLIHTPLGVERFGNRNWLLIPVVGQVQPSEFLKFGFVLVMAVGITRLKTSLRQIFTFKDLRFVALRILMPTVLSVGLVLSGNDLGTVMVFLAITAGMLFLGGLPGRWFAGAGLLGAFGVAFLIASAPSRLNRVLAHFGFVNDKDINFQIQHSQWALGSGGFTGLGPGESREKWYYLPAAETDFIYAILGEEFGLFGTVTVLVLIGFLAYGLIRVALRHEEKFASYVCVGAASWIIFQSVTNIGVVIGFLPVLGVPLPLVSSGGSSLLSTMAIIGVILSFARTEPGTGAALKTRFSVARRSQAVLATLRRKGTK